MTMTITRGAASSQCHVLMLTQWPYYFVQRYMSLFFNQKPNDTISQAARGQSTRPGSLFFIPWIMIPRSDHCWRSELPISSHSNKLKRICWIMLIKSFKLYFMTIISLSFIKLFFSLSIYGTTTYMFVDNYGGDDDDRHWEWCENKRRQSWLQVSHCAMLCLISAALNETKLWPFPVLRIYSENQLQWNLFI